ncbi:MAG: 1-phosphofructokinase family hexose kinase [Bacillota bacterium]
MITTVTLNPAIDREYFVEKNEPGEHQYIYENDGIRVSPGGKGLLSAINLKNMGYADVQNIGFVGGKQGLFFERMVQDHRVTTNYVYTKKEIRNNIFVIGKEPVSYTHYNDYTYEVNERDVAELIKRYKRGIVDSEYVMMSGSIPEGVDFDIYKKLIEIANDRDKISYLHASGEALKQALPAEPKFVVPYFKHTDKVLDEEVKTLEDYLKAGRKIQDAGAKYVMIPFHCDRLVFSEDEVYSVSAKDFCLLNWLGAGEAYNAAFFDYIFSNEEFDFVEANRYAGAAALVVAEERDIFIHDKQEIEDMVSQIKIERVE